MPFHPRNQHQGRYDLTHLVEICPALKPFIRTKKEGGLSVDFGQADAVFYLNKALLASQYQTPYWELPEGALCPPVPSRADYLHHLADLISNGSEKPPQGAKTSILDIGTGASCIYPILGTAAYRWSFVGTDVQKTSIQWAHKLLVENKRLRQLVTLRWQQNPQHIFKGVVTPSDKFAACLCNPPFFGSAKEALAQQKRKWQQLHPEQPSPNFGGQAHELYCKGGEIAFIQTMIQESQFYQQQISWFTTLVSQEKHLKPLQRALKVAQVPYSEVLSMEHGNKKSRLLCWSY